MITKIKVASRIIYKFLILCLRWKTQNNLDPITLDKLVPPIFYFIQDESIIYKYSALTLLDYIEDSNDIRDPLSRIEYNTAELLRLENLCGKRITLSKSRRQEIHDMEIIMFLENDIGIYYLEVFNDFDVFDVGEEISIYDSSNWVLIIQILNEIRTMSIWYCNSVIKNIVERIKLERSRNNSRIIRNEVHDTIDNITCFIEFDIRGPPPSMATHLGLYIEKCDIKRNILVYREMLKDLDLFYRRINLSTEIFYIRAEMLIRRLRRGSGLRRTIEPFSRPTRPRPVSPEFPVPSVLLHSRSEPNSLSDNEDIYRIVPYVEEKEDTI